MVGIMVLQKFIKEQPYERHKKRKTHERINERGRGNRRKKLHPQIHT